MDNKTSAHVLNRNSIKLSAEFFFTSYQNTRNNLVDVMLNEQPAISKFLALLDQGHKNEINKEIIIQLVTIFFHAFKKHGLKLKPINDDQLFSELNKTVDLKKYLNNSRFNVDNRAFKQFMDGFRQKEILNYTYFAIKNQFRNSVNNDRDALFIFYMIKTIIAVMDNNIIP